MSNKKETPEQEDKRLGLELETKLKSIFPNYKIDQGLRYRRWVVLESNSEVEQIAVQNGADNFFSGKICGQPAKILFFGDRYPESR